MRELSPNPPLKKNITPPALQKMPYPPSPFLNKSPFQIDIKRLLIKLCQQPYVKSFQCYIYSNNISLFTKRVNIEYNHFIIVRIYYKEVSRLERYTCQTNICETSRLRLFYAFLIPSHSIVASLLRNRSNDYVCRGPGYLERPPNM